MNKLKIVGSEFSDMNLKLSVCSHLKPILEFLERNGNSYDHNTPNFTDKGGGATRFIRESIDFDHLEKVFEIPSFIKLNRDEKAVVCTRCWCVIAEGCPP